MANRRQSITLKIKNMVCDRCVRVVREELVRLGVNVVRVTLGEAEILPGKSAADLTAIRSMLTANGFELLDDRRVQRVEEIKRLLIQHVRSLDARSQPPPKYARFLSQALNADYHSLSALFSSVENLTIEQFVILQKIERVKELLVYGELTLSEISYLLGYSSVPHLSAQFKQTTGFTPTAFKQLKSHRRTPIDKVHRGV